MSNVPQANSSVRSTSSRIGTAQVYESVSMQTPQQLARRILAQTQTHEIGTQAQSQDNIHAAMISHQGTSVWDQAPSNTSSAHHIHQSSTASLPPPQAYYVTRGGRTAQRQFPMLDGGFGSDNVSLLPRQLGSSIGSASNPQARPQFRSKVVCVLDCKHCSSQVCKRGMKAILLADMNVELFSTDAPPFGVQLVNDDYRTRNCFCRIRDVACLGCGNVIGYHVTQPCEPCMDACNNGHFWMFHCTEVASSERQDASGTKALVWSQIPRADRDMDYSLSHTLALQR